MTLESFALFQRWLLCFILCIGTGQAYAQFEVETKHSDVGRVAPPPKAPLAANEKPIGAEDVDVDPFLLGAIRHRTLKVRDDEVDAFYHVLEHARRVKYDLQKKVASENVKRHEQQFHQQPGNARVKFSLFANLFKHPEEYTGELLTMKGYIRKNIKNPDDPEDPHPVPSYEAWLFLPDAQHNPVCVIYSDLPTGMPLGGNLIETVEVTGYFFKVYGYRAQDGLRAAPMLLAKTLEWTPRVVQDKTYERLVYFLITGTVVVGMILAFWFVNRRQHQRLSAATREPADFDPRDLQSLNFESTTEDRLANDADKKVEYEF